MVVRLFRQVLCVGPFLAYLSGFIVCVCVHIHVHTYVHIHTVAISDFYEVRIYHQTAEVNYSP